MAHKSRMHWLVLFTLVLLILAYYIYIADRQLMIAPRWHKRLALQSSISNGKETDKLDDDDQNSNNWHHNESFDIHGKDVIVFLHIQKTGGTKFGRHLVRDLQLQVPCSCPSRRQGRGRNGKKKKIKMSKKCKCLRPNSTDIWLFSRYSTGWACGLHADYTELVECLPYYFRKFDSNHQIDRGDRQYHFITELREPINRYLSEFYHVGRGATWKRSLHKCNGTLPSTTELPSCYNNKRWKAPDFNLIDFMSCKYNLANNRQTRMLADLRLVNCYNLKSLPLKQRHDIMLSSAKENLRKMSYFGLLEFQQESQLMFEHRFQMKFIRPFTTYDFNQTYASQVYAQLNDDLKAQLKQINLLDVQLYNYALQLFKSRWNKLKKKLQIDT